VALRNALGTRSMSAITQSAVITQVLNPGFWPGFPWPEIGQLYNVIIPMSYWSERSQPDWHSGERYTGADISLIRQLTGRPDMPVHVAGGIASGITLDDVAGMVRAIANGEVDAQENPLTNIRLFGLERYHRHVTTTAHFHGVALVLCNARAWSAWPQPVRDALAAAVAEATDAQWRFSAEDDVACRAELTRQGVQIVDPDAAEREAFRQAVAAVAAAQRAALPAAIARLLTP
jgi:hypothetical protein